MSSNLICDIDILQPRDVLHLRQPRDGIKPSARSTIQVTQNPVVGGISVDEAAGHRGPCVHPCRSRRCYRGTEEIDILHDTECLLFCQLIKRVEDYSGSQAVASERDGPDSGMALNEDICQYQARLVCSIERVRPRVVDQVAQLGQDYV